MSTAPAVAWLLLDVGGVLEIVDDETWAGEWARRWAARLGMTAEEFSRRSDALDLPEMRAEFWDAYCGVANTELLDALRAGDAALVARHLGNDLQAAAVSLAPDLRRTLRAGVNAGALAGIVSGSGPTCAFLAIDAVHARDLALSLTTTGVAHTAVAAHGPVHGATMCKT